MKGLSLAVAAAVALAITGCGSSSPSSSGPAPPAASSIPGAGSTEVTMKDVAFTPRVLHAKVGQTVHWTNEDSVIHNVSYVSGPKFTSSGSLGHGATFSLKLTRPGTIHYVCTIHPFMTATIVVGK